jgi:hypothetical protein
LATSRGEFFIRRITPRFLQQFNHVGQRFYDASRGSREIISYRTLVRGYGVARQHCKVYRKADRRVRIEVALKRETLQRMLPTRSLMEESGPADTDPFEVNPRERRYDILSYVDRLVSEVFPDIEYLLERERHRPSESRSPTEFQTRLSVIIRDHVVVEQVLERLIVHHRITTVVGDIGCTYFGAPRHGRDF